MLANRSQPTAYIRNKQLKDVDDNVFRTVKLPWFYIMIYLGNSTFAFNEQPVRNLYRVLAVPNSQYSI